VRSTKLFLRTCTGCPRSTGPSSSVDLSTYLVFPSGFPYLNIKLKFMSETCLFMSETFLFKNSTKLFLDLYLNKFLKTLAKLFY